MKSSPIKSSSPPRETKSREALFAELRQDGFRLTPQRERIIDLFYALPHGTHLNAEEIFHRLKDEDHDISLATSYRTLKLLASVGVLRELDFGEDHKHYELSRQESPHHHIICMRCGQTVEFESAEVLELATRAAQRRHFEVSDVQLKVFGTCKRCPEEPNHRRMGTPSRL